MMQKIDLPTQGFLAEILCHYTRNWGAAVNAWNWKKGPTHEFPPGFCVLEFPPTRVRSMWTTATCGMSFQGDAEPLEIFMFSPMRAESLVELLTATAHYHLTGEYLGIGHTVNFGQPWLSGSRCDHGLLSLPYLDGPEFEWAEILGRRVRFLWLVPITLQELEFKKKNGIEALEALFESVSVNYLDPMRNSVA